MVYWFQTEACQGKSMLAYNEQLRGSRVECPNKEAAHLRGLTVYSGIKFDNKHSWLVAYSFSYFVFEPQPCTLF